MRILQNLTPREWKAYVSQPTAKQLIDRMRRDGVEGKPGDKSAADVCVVAGSVGKGRNETADTAEISVEGRNLQGKAAADAGEQDNMEWLSITKSGAGKCTVHLSGSGEIAQILKKGYFVVEGKKIMLDKHQRNALAAAGKAMEKDQQATFNRMFLDQQLARSRQQTDAWKKSAQQQSRVMATAMRIMKGRSVSLNDEKELAEISPELYGMAKNAGTLEKIKESHEERERQRRISEANERQRAEENEVRDYSVPPRSAYPNHETQICVDLGEGTVQAGSISEVTTMLDEG